MGSPITVKGQLSGKEYLQAYIWGLETIETGQKAEAVDNTHTYIMWVRLKNTYKNVSGSQTDYDDKWWYYDISLRIIPETAGVQLYSGAGFRTPVTRRDFEVHRLTEQAQEWLAVYLKWTKSTQKDVNELKFSFGLYAQEVQRVKNWAGLYP